MHVQVRLQSRQEEGMCSSCQEYHLCVVFQVQTGVGADDTPPVCTGCLSNGTGLLAIVEQPDMRPRAQPPDKRMKRRALKQELDITQGNGGIRHKASGALPGLKGDGRKKGVYRIEGKVTKANSFTITRSVLDKIRSEASYREVPAVVISFVDKNTLQEQDRWTLIPWEDWEEKIANAVAHDR